MGAEPPSVVPLRTLLRENSLQDLKGGKIPFYFFLMVQTFPPMLNLQGPLCQLLYTSKKVHKVLVRSELKEAVLARFCILSVFTYLYLLTADLPASVVAFCGCFTVKLFVPHLFDLLVLGCY